MRLQRLSWGVPGVVELFGNMLFLILDTVCT